MIVSCLAANGAVICSPKKSSTDCKAHWRHLWNALYKNSHYTRGGNWGSVVNLSLLPSHNSLRPRWGQGLRRNILIYCFLYLLRNIKRPRASICCDINTMGVVEHERSLRETRGVRSQVFLWLLECSATSRVFISQHIDRKRPFYIAFIKYFEAVKISVLWYRNS
jgi:hypothetical protein